jgi:hypothetical protein
MNEAEIEHDSAKALIRRLERMRPSDPKYPATRKVNLKTLGNRLMARKIRLTSRQLGLA